MARIRTIKPELFSNEQLCTHGALTRLLFIGLITQADDKGRLPLRWWKLRHEIMPADDVGEQEIMEMLRELHEAELITIYEVEGKRYIHVRTFNDHQVINRPTPSKLPPPPGHLTEHSLISRARVERNGREGKGTEGTERTTTAEAVRPQVDRPDEEPELELVNDQPHELAEDPPPPAEEPRQSAGANPDDLAAFENTWKLYTSFGSPNSSKSNARRRFLKLDEVDQFRCYTGLLKYRQWFVDERKRRPDAMAKHLETFIDARGWEGYSHLPVPD
jgi:hypothetical protein